MRIVQCNAIRIYYCNDAKKINDCLNTSQCGSGREAFVGCKFHRSAGVHLVLHCNGHHWKRRQLFYLLPTAVKPSSFNGKPSQPKSDLPCTGINSMPSNSCWHATWYPFCQVRLPMPKNMPRIHSIGISSCCSCHPGMSCLKADWHLLWTQACPGLCCCSSNVMWTQACPGLYSSDAMWTQVCPSPWCCCCCSYNAMVGQWSVHADEISGLFSDALLQLHIQHIIDDEILRRTWTSILWSRNQQEHYLITNGWWHFCFEILVT